MSSWYVFSSLGFYPVNPSNGIYVFGRPIFDKVALKLPENKVFEIKTVNNSRENKYIQSVLAAHRGGFYPYKVYVLSGTINWIMILALNIQRHVADL